jgi:hypothetical protein
MEQERSFLLECQIGTSLTWGPIFVERTAEKRGLYDKHLELLEKVKADPTFESHMGTSGKNQTKAKPIELLVLGSIGTPAQAC